MKLAYLDSLIKLARKRGVDRDTAIDIVYQAYTQMFTYEKTHTVRDRESLLRRIVINLTINEYHRSEKNKFQFVPLSKARFVPDPHAGPDRILEGEQDLDVVFAVLHAISARTAQIFLAQRAGYRYDELASAFSVRPRTIEKHVDRGATAIEEWLNHGTLLTDKMWSKQW